MNRIDWDAEDDIPISLETIKQQLRISHDEFDELILETHLPGAVEWAEGVMHRSILEKEHRWVLDEFPCGAIRLPRGKTQSVTSVKYSSGGVTQSVTDYQSDLSSNSGGVLMPAWGGVWPIADCDVISPVTITFVAGWTQSTVPADIKLALTQYIGDALDVSSAADLTANTNLNIKDTLLSAWILR